MSEGLARGSFCPGGLCPDTHFDQEKTMILRRLVSLATLFDMFHAGTRKSLLDLWPPLLQLPIKFVLSILVYVALSKQCFKLVQSNSVEKII